MVKEVTQYHAESSLHMWTPLHVYKNIWEVAVGEIVVCMLEPGNFHDRNIVAVEKSERIIGHLPRKVSHICTLFLKR